MITASTKELVALVGTAFTDGQCWDPFLRDAFKNIAGIELPESYYDALGLFDTVHDARRAVPFTPLPWDVVMSRAHPFLVLHCGIAIDGERWVQPWGEAGVVICNFADPQWSKRIAGFLRFKCESKPSDV